MRFRRAYVVVGRRAVEAHGLRLPRLLHGRHHVPRHQAAERDVRDEGLVAARETSRLRGGRLLGRRRYAREEAEDDRNARLRRARGSHLRPSQSTRIMAATPRNVLRPIDLIATVSRRGAQNLSARI